MAKLKEVSTDELSDLIGRTQDLTGEAHGVTRRLESNLRTPIEKPIQAASSALAASRAFADLAHAILIRASLAEQEREIKAMVEQRVKGTQ